MPWLTTLQGSSPTWRRVVLAGSAALLVTGCLAGPLPPFASTRPSTLAEPPIARTPEPTLEPTAPNDGVLAKLDPTSRDILAVIEPGERVESIVHAPDAAAFVAEAKQHGLEAALIDKGSAEISGDRDIVVSLIGGPRVQAAELSEILTADRWIAPDRPTVSIPTPGSPYVGRPIATSPSLVDAPAERLGPMLAELGREIVTIDGLPYDRLVVSTACAPDGCELSAAGHVLGSADTFDSWGIQSVAALGWVPGPSVNAMTLGGVPRRLGRAAEWIARHDESTAREIARYTTIAWIRWDPTAVGVIEIGYDAACTEAVAPDGTRVAQTGICLDFLQVRVDLGTGRVVSTKRGSS